LSVAVGLIASQALVAAVGYALLRALGVAKLERADAGLVGLAYLSGWATLGMLATLGLILGAGESLALLLAESGIAIVACLWLARTTTPVPEAVVVQSRGLLARATSWVSWALIAVAAASAAVIASTVQWDATDDFDAFNFWIPKAQVIYWSHGLDAQLWGLFAHPEYPPLAPAADAMTFFLAGMHPSLLPTQRTLLGLAFLLSLVAVLGRHVSRWILLPFVAALATAGWFWGELRSAMIDAPVAYLVGAAAAVGFTWLLERRHAWLVLAWIFIAAASLTKFEGFFFGGLLAAVLAGAALVRYRHRGLPAAWLLLAPASILLWRAWLGRHGLPTANSSDYHLSDVLDPSYLSERTFRLTAGVRAIRRELEELISATLGGRVGPVPQAWILVIPWLAVLVLAGRRLRVAAAAAGLWVLAALGGLALIYWMARPPIHFYISVTVERVVPTVVIAGGAIVTLLLGASLLPTEVAAAAPAPHRVPGAGRGRLAAIAAALCGLVIVALADARPSTDRARRPDGRTLARQLVSQFRQEQAFAGYFYPLTATCDGTTPDGLAYSCVVSTTTPVGSPATIITWNVSVSCMPAANEGPRCYTSRGEALD
jgi:hypothetical protein